MAPVGARKEERNEGNQRNVESLILSCYGVEAPFVSPSFHRRVQHSSKIKLNPLDSGLSLLQPAPSLSVVHVYLAVADPAERAPRDFISCSCKATDRYEGMWTGYSSEPRYFRLSKSPDKTVLEDRFVRAENEVTGAQVRCLEIADSNVSGVYVPST